MFPERVGSLVLDGMEYAPDARTPWDWGTTSLDNVTDAFEDGFIGECVKAGHDSCALATNEQSDLIDYEAVRATLSIRVRAIFQSTLKRPIPGVSSNGPGIVTYGQAIEWLYSTLYHPDDWKEAAKALAQLEAGNATLMLNTLQEHGFSFDPMVSEVWDDPFPGIYASRQPSSQELQTLVICVS